MINLRKLDVESMTVDKENPVFWSLLTRISQTELVSVRDEKKKMEIAKKKFLFLTF